MPSSIAHAAAAVLLQPALTRADRTPRLLTIAGIAAALPDLDAIGRPFGLGDVAWLGGHRALTHSLAMAFVTAAVATFILNRRASLCAPSRALLFFLLVVASHGFLDAFTTYGTGVEFLAPFSARRFRASWRPFDGLWPEILVLWLPAFAILAAVRAREHSR